MRILHINLERGWRGGERQALNIMMGLKDLGHENYLLARKNDVFIRRVREKKFAVKVIKKPFLLSGPYLKKFDVIHAHEVRGLQLATLWQWYHRRPLVYTRSVVFMPSRNPFTVYKYKKVDHLIANSKDSMNMMLKWGVDPSRMSVIYGGIPLETCSDPAKVAALRLRFKGRKVVGCIASLEREKDHLTLIDAASLINKTRNDLVFLIIGDGSLRSMLEQRTAAMGINNISFEGYQDDPYSYYDICDVITLTSREESISNAALDAFLYRVPVVATRAGAIPEIVKDNETGLLVDIGNPHMLADAIMRILDDDSLSRICCKNAYALLLKEFSVENMAKAYELVYHNVLSHDK